VINVAGHRLSTGAMEEVLAAHPDVAECAVIGVADSLKGQLPVVFPGDTPGEIERAIDSLSRVGFNPDAATDNARRFSKERFRADFAREIQTLKP